MNNVNSALRGAQHSPLVEPPLRPLHRLLVVGAGGVLGAALLAQALVAGRFQEVQALTRGPLASSLRGLQPLHHDQLACGPGVAAELAVLVFERRRHANGRDDAFVQPDPEDLLPLAAALHRAGVRHLVVLVPHAPALLPHALKAGFASHAEADVAALGFTHLVFVRAAQNASAPEPGRAGLQAFAAWWLSQLSWMVPTREQPVRAVRLAYVAAQLARQLPDSPPGTRVLPPELVWQAAQMPGDPSGSASPPAAAAELALDAWLRQGWPR